MSNRTIRVFENGVGVDVRAGATALDAVQAWNSQSASEVAAGTRLITDSRGLPIDSATPMSAGSILRLIAKRDRDGAQGAESDQPDA
jgi:hypothetical protein